MNPDTGRIYEGEAEIAAARERGEKLIELSPDIQRQISAPPLNRRERRALKRGENPYLTQRRFLPDRATHL